MVLAEFLDSTSRAAYNRNFWLNVIPAYRSNWSAMDFVAGNEVGIWPVIANASGSMTKCHPILCILT
jgi:hypothetical protein